MSRYWLTSQDKREDPVGYEEAVTRLCDTYLVHDGGSPDTGVGAGLCAGTCTTGAEAGRHRFETSAPLY